MIRCGRDHTLALLANGKAIGWGGDGSGRIPADAPAYCASAAPARPVEVLGSDRLVDIAAGSGVSLAITATGRVVIWGASVAGIGGRYVPVATPQPIAGIAHARAVAAGAFAFGVVDAAGNVHTWGLNGVRALGRPTAALNATPDRVSDLPRATALAAGHGFMLALTHDNVVYAWGGNAAGQLAMGHLFTVVTPQPAQIDATVYAIAAGATHALALTARGDVLAWGSNQRGQLGRAKPLYSSVPLDVELPERARAIAAGMHFSLALGESGHAYAWGFNGFGQLGLGDTADRRRATRVPGVDDAQGIAAGETHAAAWTARAALAWGDNAVGQLGEAPARQPFPVALLA